MSLRDTIGFMLERWLAVPALLSRSRYEEHSLDTLAAILDSCERISNEKFAPFNRLVDVQEPRLEGDVVVQPACVQEAARAYAESGMLAAAQNHELGGMQLPYVVEVAANALFAKAGIGVGGGHMLTVANANLLLAHGTPAQKDVFAAKELAGQWSGTMCLSEPQAGSSLSDITTRAVLDGEEGLVDPLGPRYRLFGNKMWISNGDHELTENIVHLVLAKTPDSDGRLTPGTRGISLFIVPKRVVDATGELTGVRNDVAVAGLNHKLGYRGIPNTLLNFGEGRYAVAGQAGAIGYRVGAEGDGLRCMFHMMNEARIGVGNGAAAVGYAGFEASLGYARERRQGRPMNPMGKDTSSRPVRIVEHADVKRMLLAQKAYAEGALALTLYCALLVDETRTGEQQSAERARLLLELLTPVAKSWPSEWCLEANNLAIQVLGGYGYTRDFPVEQFWRDNRLNMIHEGTHGIQALDLLSRKVKMEDGAALDVLEARISATADRSRAHESLAQFGPQLIQAWSDVRGAARSAWDTPDPQEALANATPFLQAFGHTIVAWLWLDIGLAIVGANPDSTHPWRGKRQALTYFYRYELPKIDGWLGVVGDRDRTCLDTRDDWFEQ